MRNKCDIYAQMIPRVAGAVEGLRKVKEAKLFARRRARRAHISIELISYQNIAYTSNGLRARYARRLCA